MAGLTDIKVRSAKPGAQVMKLSDGGGLQLWVTPADGKYWKLAYRFDGKQKKLGIGPYPALGLQLSAGDRA
ncbi:Arm DNA-binding domain-containing protein [Bosea sp. (in: a-proteobacteria)]|jgi:hypothetical protein|uniref:Arm DNA-binding domain-containing protein n=1 Tax=Bosea sp. (in: a-proteobacteria) TaxID=1871050 RepID=UPI001AC1D147|nr:Arm DNA-binding domain-containing protein [Bosea sp. (in: a-proteobacteria)]MBN9437145.1 DUF4102 domain-containing protein [Bosea sp. (in: a-proteobacteria)]MBN9445924.1 DUF4102 domain-containing protein [Bosea sp. (in: a-proteobacteria)]